MGFYVVCIYQQDMVWCEQEGGDKAKNPHTNGCIYAYHSMIEKGIRETALKAKSKQLS